MRDLDWEILSVLYETRNITKTAERLFMTQPTLTRRLQIIEEELDAVLITRSNKGVQFTEEGSYAALRARDILQTIANVRETIAMGSGTLSGTIRLGAPKSYMHFVIPHLLEKFSGEFPSVRFEIITDLSHELLHSLEAAQLDVSFVRGQIHTTLHKELLSEDQLYIVNRDPFSMEELAAMPRIDYAKESTIVEATERWWNERFSSRPNKRFDVYSGEACLQMVKSGLGYGIFSDSHYIDPADGLYAVPMVFKDGSRFLRPSWIVCDEKSLSRSRLLTAFVDFIHDYKDTFWPKEATGQE